MSTIGVLLGFDLFCRFWVRVGPNAHRGIGFEIRRPAGLGLRLRRLAVTLCGNTALAKIVGAFALGIGTSRYILKGLNAVRIFRGCSFVSSDT